VAVRHGAPSRVSEELAVTASLVQTLEIQLLWNTPNDPDQSDEGPEAGSDLDLHLLHPFATGFDVDEDGQPDMWSLGFLAWPSGSFTPDEGPGGAPKITANYEHPLFAGN
jgi:hypothetical protein